MLISEKYIPIFPSHFRKRIHTYITMQIDSPNYIELFLFNHLIVEITRTSRGNKNAKILGSSKLARG